MFLIQRIERNDFLTDLLSNYTNFLMDKFKENIKAEVTMKYVFANGKRPTKIEALDPLD